MVDIVVGQVTVPDVTNTDQSSAEAALIAVYLAIAYDTSQYSGTIANGHVISQSPAAASSVDPGSTVTLVLSLGEFVPTAGLGSGLIQMTKRRRSRSRRRKFRKVIRQ